MTPSQTKRYMISRANKYTNTKGETQFNEYQLSRSMKLRHDVRLSFFDPRAQMFTFQCDFLLANCTFPTEVSSCYSVDFEIDGKGHKTKWDDWKDTLKVKAGLTVVHIPEPITASRYWYYLDAQIRQALFGTEKVFYVRA